MTLTVAALILSVLIGGLASKRFENSRFNVQLVLVFAGSYLFSITIIHIIPELFVLSTDPHRIGIFVLAGFFLQRLLEYFSKGVEHGHAHSHGLESGISRFSMLAALIIHSILEGSLLTHESPFHEQHESYSLLLGIVLHKMPAAFALMLILGRSKFNYLMLLLFALGSPIGLLMGGTFDLTSNQLIVLFAVVCGSFLHISTTIFVETSPEHGLPINKTLVSLLGAGLAIMVEYVI